ncbi:MAG TPA: OPT/YSL family transporter, partial [Candidatus Limnocylindrales bacterium]|nr:OPT/YSL family transporter [Candidatus Limnocylindrales bacterium]
FGLAWIFQWYYAVLFFMGGAIAWLWQKKWPENAEEFVYPVASGVIAGGSLIGVFLVFWENAGEMVKIVHRVFG